MTHPEPGAAPAGRRTALPWLVGVAAVALVVGGFAVGRWVVPNAAEPSSTAPSDHDVEFAQLMIVHHNQALQMARTLIARVDDPAREDLRALAGQIIDSQTREVGMMTGWLLLWGEGQNPDGDAGSGAPHHEHSGNAIDATDGGAMADMGMATQEEMAELASAGGAALDRLFVQLMTRHHLGAVTMAEATAQRSTVPTVRTTAAGMAVEQTREIQYLAGVAARMEAAGAPVPDMAAAPS